MNDDSLIVVAEGTFAAIAGTRTSGGRTFTFQPGDLSSAKGVEAATKDASAVVVGLQHLGAEEIDALGADVQAIGRAGVGLDSISLSAARRRGIAVIHQPSFATEEVADHAMALLLALSRRLMVADDIARNGWRGRRRLAGMRSLNSMTAGVVGCGRIGRAVVERLRPFVKEILVYDPYAEELPRDVRRCSSLQELLPAADALSLHAPLSEESRYLLGQDDLALLPDGALIINVARGGLIDEDALAKALVEGRIGGAGIDVFAEEPIDGDAAILAAPNTILSPHAAFLTHESVTRLEIQTAEDVCSYLMDGTVRWGRLAVGGSK